MTTQPDKPRDPRKDPKADLAELDRLYAAATPGLIRRYFGGEPCQVGVGIGPYTQIADFKLPEDAHCYVEIHNAYPALAVRIRELESGGFVRIVMEMAKDIAARDARMKREGAAECAAELYQKIGELIYDKAPPEKILDLLSAAARLRTEGGE